ncbi:hypothetical protein EJ110_NYTH20212 [Nymphaea thermarum]|nr:hypothetical protein EJ110_NYTH20212 [Nymphaea thermarum]
MEKAVCFHSSASLHDSRLSFVFSWAQARRVFSSSLFCFTNGCPLGCRLLGSPSAVGPAVRLVSQGCARRSSNLIPKAASRGVTLEIQDRHVVLGNGIVQVTLSKPEGMVTGIKYNRIDNLLEIDDEGATGG